MVLYKAWIWLSNLATLALVLYIAYSMKQFYDVFNPDDCKHVQGKSDICYEPVPGWRERYAMGICVSFFPEQPERRDECDNFFTFSEAQLNETFKRKVSFEVPKTSRLAKASIYLVVAPRANLHKNPFKAASLDFAEETSLTPLFNFTKYKYMPIRNESRRIIELRKTYYKDMSEPEREAMFEGQRSFYRQLAAKGQDLRNIDDIEVFFNQSELAALEDPNGPPGMVKTIHYLRHIRLRTLDEDKGFFKSLMDNEIGVEIHMASDDFKYLPIVEMDYITAVDEKFVVHNDANPKVSIIFENMPMSFGRFRFYKQIEASLFEMKAMGFSDAQLKEITSIFTDNNVHLILITFVVAMFHLLFEFLAFKNDISFWRNRKTTIGISVKTIIWRAVSQIIIFAYLLEEETSILIVVPAGISVVIEIWKCLRVFKLSLKFDSFVPKIQVGEKSKAEKESDSYDGMAMKKLSYVLYPLCIGYAIYSFVYNTHKTYYSWLINSLVNAVYAFGFLFMTPQLFINYKMKSVAHLPWRAFMYKAFNTFIDDLFAFIIKMPTMHRLACLRDDVVFVIYLYQRWLYPIDKNRVNEFGESFEDEPQQQVEKKDKKKLN